MKRTPAALSFVLTAAAATPWLLIAAEEAIPELAAPNYSAYSKGGFAPKGDDVELRCENIPPQRAEKFAYPDATAKDLSVAPCKHHVWKLLSNTADWNTSRAQAKAAWDGASAAAQIAKLKEISDYFHSLDGRYGVTLRAAKAVWAAHKQAYDGGGCRPGKPAAATIWDGDKPAAAVVEYYRAVQALQAFLNRGAGSLEAPAADAGPTAVVDPKVIEMLGSTDDVMGAHFAAMQNGVGAILAKCRGAAPTPEGEVARAGRKLGQDLTAWKAEIKTDGQKTAAKMFDGAVAEGSISKEDAAKAMASLKETHALETGGKKYLSQRVVVPGPDGKTAIDTYKYVELKPETTFEDAVAAVVRATIADKPIRANLENIKGAAKEATVANAAADFAREQGPFAFMSGQTKPDMERKIENERAAESSVALGEFTGSKESLQRELDAAWADCLKIWKEVEDERPVIMRTLKGEAQAAALIRLNTRQEALTVAGPSEPGAKERKSVKCTAQRAEIERAYSDAFAGAAKRLEEKNQVLAGKAVIDRDSVAADEEARKELRRHYFREKFLETRPLLVKQVTGTSDPETKLAIVNEYLISNWADPKRKVFYLDGWKNVAPPAKLPAAASASPEIVKARVDQQRALYRDWSTNSRAQNSAIIPVALEDEFISDMDKLFPFWKKSVLHSEGPDDEQAVKPRVQEWIEAKLIEAIAAPKRNFLDRAGDRVRGDKKPPRLGDKRDDKPAEPEPRSGNAR